MMIIGMQGWVAPEGRVEALSGTIEGAQSNMRNRQTRSESPM